MPKKLTNEEQRRQPLRCGRLVRRTIYRNFRVIERDGEIRILSACGDSHPADSLADAHQQIDSWYKEGSVEW